MLLLLDLLGYELRRCELQRMPQNIIVVRMWWYRLLLVLLLLLRPSSGGHECRPGHALNLLLLKLLLLLLLLVVRHLQTLNRRWQRPARTWA